jgi:hypothetical protein
LRISGWIRGRQQSRIICPLTEVESSLQALKEDPAAFARQEHLVIPYTEKKREELFTIYRNLSAVLLQVTQRARQVSQNKDDDYAVSVLGELETILAGDDVPEGDTLFASLIDAFPILIDLIDDKELVLENEKESSIFIDAGAFNNGIRNICKDYWIAREQAGGTALPLSDTDILAKKLELEDERSQLESSLSQGIVARNNARSLKGVIAEHQRNIIGKLEAGIGEMTGRHVQIQLDVPAPVS